MSTIALATIGAPMNPPRSTVAFIAFGRPPTSNKTVGKYGAQAKQEYSRLYKVAGGAHSNELSYAAVYCKRGLDPTLLKAAC